MSEAKREAIRIKFREREKHLNQLFDDERQRLYQIRQERQRQAEQDYKTAIEALETQHEQEIEDLDNMARKELGEVA